MTRPRLFRTSLNGGEIAPELQWRTDLQRFVNSCLELENFLVQPTGGVKRRPGTAFVRDWPAGRPVRLVPFEFSASVYYLVVLRERLEDEEEPEGEGNEAAVWLEVYEPNGTRMTEIRTAYPAAGLGRIQHIQSYDVLFLAHPSVPLMRLERVDPESWRFVEHKMRGGPYLDRNADAGAMVQTWFEPFIPERVYAPGDCVTEALAVTMVPSSDFALQGSGNVREVEWIEGGRRFVRRYYRMRCNVDTLWNGLPSSNNASTTMAPGHVALFKDAAGAEWIARPVSAVNGSGTQWIEFDTEYYTQQVFDWETGEELTAEAEDTTGAFPASWRPAKLYGCPRFREYVSDATKAESFWEFGEATPGDGTPLSSIAGARPVKLFTGRAWAVARVTGTERGTALTAQDSEAPWEPRVAQRGNIFTQDRVGARFRTDIDAGRVQRGSFYGAAAANGVFAEIRYHNGTFVFTSNTDGNLVLTSVGVPMRAYGQVRLRTEGGTWAGEIVLQESQDQVDWTDIGSFISRGQSNGEIDREVSASGAFVRARMETMTQHPFGGENPHRCLFTISVMDSVQQEYLVDEVLLERGYFAQLRAVYGVAQRADTHRWAFGVFGPNQGYPSALTFHEERLWLAGTETRPNTIWASAINDFEEFQLGTLATSPLELTIASDQLNRIQWLRSHGDLLIGCDDSEWTVDGRDSDQPVSASNIRARRSSIFGAEPVQAEAGVGHLAYIQRGGLRIRGMAYSWEAESYQAADMTAVAPHLGRDGEGFIEVHHAAVPHDMLWALRADGQVAVLSWDGAQQVDGWARMRFGNGARSLCVTPGGRFGRQLWLAVVRGDPVVGEQLCLERLDLGADDYLDCHVKAEDPSGVAEIAVPPIEGAGGFTVVGDNAMRLGEPPGDSRDRGAAFVFGDGKDWTFDQYILSFRDPSRWKNIIAGWQYGCTARPLPPILGDDAYGGRVNLSELTLFLRESWSADVSVDGGRTFETLAMHREDAAYGPLLVTGPVRLKRSSGAREALEIVVRAEGYTPFHLCALAAAAARLE